MATINESDTMMGAISAPARVNTFIKTRDKNVPMLFWASVGLNVLLLISTGYLAWRGVSPVGAPPSNLAVPQQVGSNITATATASLPLPTIAPLATFFGKIVSVEGNKLTVQEFIQPAAPGQKGSYGKLRTATLSDNTSLTYQKPNTDDSVAPYTPVPGKVEDLKKDVNGLFTINEALNAPTLTINRIDYVDKLPFAY